MASTPAPLCYSDRTMASGTVVVPNPTCDVTFGRGKRASSWPGNITFRHIVWSQRAAYQASPRQLRHSVAKLVVDKVHATGGRFLQAESDGTHVLASMKRIMEKALQALREKDVAKPQGYERSQWASRRRPKAASVIKRKYTKRIVHPEPLPLSRCKPVTDGSSDATATVWNERTCTNTVRCLAETVPKTYVRKESGHSSHVNVSREHFLSPNSHAFNPISMESQDQFGMDSVITNYVSPSDPPTVVAPYWPGESDTDHVNSRSALPLHMRVLFQSLYPQAQEEAFIPTENEFFPNHTVNPDCGLMGMTSNRMDCVDSPATVIDADHAIFPTDHSLSPTVLLFEEGKADEILYPRDYEPFDTWCSFVYYRSF